MKKDNLALCLGFAVFMAMCFIYYQALSDLGGSNPNFILDFFVLFVITNVLIRAQTNSNKAKKLAKNQKFVMDLVNVLQNRPEDFYAEGSCKCNPNVRSFSTIGLLNSWLEIHKNHKVKVNYNLEKKNG